MAATGSSRLFALDTGSRLEQPMLPAMHTRTFWSLCCLRHGSARLGRGPKSL